MKSKKYIEEAIQNIKDDREITRELLDDAIRWLSVDDARHKEIGMTLAKYVETLQRSNEQLVKLAALVHKKNATRSTDSLSEGDKEELFDLIQKAN